MKKFNLIIVMVLISNIASAFFGKPAKPDLLSDTVLIPEKQFEVKAFKVVQLVNTIGSHSQATRSKEIYH